MIPKVIHWCWLSGEAIPEEIEECVNSWRRIMPDYKIKCWTTDDFDINSVPYVRTAYEQKRWAFCADYIRAYALYTEGGIYFDSDVMAIENFDSYLKYKCVLFVEKQKFVSDVDIDEIKEKFVQANCEFPSNGIYSPNIGIQAAVMLSEQGHPFFEEILSYYKRLQFSPNANNKNGILIAPTIYASIAVKYGFRYKDCRQSLSHGIEVFSNSLINHGEYRSLRAIATHLEKHSWVVVPWSRRLHSICSRVAKRILSRLKFMLKC